MTEFIDALHTFFKADKYVEASNIKIEEVNEEKAVIVADIDERHLNANGCVQGGMLYTIADFAFAVLGNYLHPSTVTQTGQITYLRPAFTKRLKAVAKEKERAGHCTVCETVVYDENDKVLCVCSFNGFIKEITKQEFIERVNKR